MSTRNLWAQRSVQIFEMKINEIDNFKKKKSKIWETKHDLKKAASYINWNEERQQIKILEMIWVKEIDLRV